MKLTVLSHPLLEIEGFVSEFSHALGAPWPELALPVLLSLAPPELAAVDPKTAVRDLLRHGGFKPAGRNKPASESLRKAIPAGRLAPVNAAVDAGNAASFHSGLPISVVDLDRVTQPLHIEIAPAGSSYVFNPSGRVLELGGLVVLSDGEGPCANAVKDSQRTKTHDGTMRTLSVIWGTSALPGRAARVGEWYRNRLLAAGVRVSPCVVGT